jgi:hypothetical protein
MLLTVRRLRRAVSDSTEVRNFLMGFAMRVCLGRDCYEKWDRAGIDKCFHA